MEEKKAKIEAAIEAHLKWLEHLNSALVHGESEFDPDMVGADDHCEFAKWLDDPNFKQLCFPEIYDEIKSAHALFHKKAGNILRLTINGHKPIAQLELKSNAELMKYSERLTTLLRML